MRASVVKAASGAIAEQRVPGTPPARESYIRELVPQRRETAATSLVRALLEVGVDTYFGVPGGPVSPIFDAILQTPQTRLVESRHETNAAFSAIGYWRATGRVPAVVVTAGPGATNAVTGIVSAHLERVPMIVLCGDVPWATHGGKLLQDSGPEGIGIELMLARAVRAAVRVALPRSAASQTMTAFAAATNTQRPGPALVVVPLDIGNHETEAPPIVRAHRVVDERIDSVTVREVRELLEEAERPLLVIGAACRPHAPVIRRLVDHLNLPFMTTPQAKGLISEEHPCSLRNGGLAASRWARRYTDAGVDVALALGTDLDDCAAGPTPPIGPGGRLVHVDTDPTVFNRNYVTHMAIVADVGAFATQLADEAAQCFSPRPCVSHALRKAREVIPTEEFDESAHASDAIRPDRVIRDLERACPSDTTFVTDIGEHMLFALHYLTARRPDQFVIHLGLGSMASGICSAVGLALGNRSRRVVCICGDGGMQMAGAELLVAIKNRLPIVYAVFNDARYNMVYHGYKDVFGREAAWSAPPIDFAAWARSMGMVSARIDRPGQITRQGNRRVDSARRARRAGHSTQRRRASPRRGPKRVASSHVDVGRRDVRVGRATA